MDGPYPAAAAAAGCGSDVHVGRRVVMEMAVVTTVVMVIIRVVMGR